MLLIEKFEMENNQLKEYTEEMLKEIDNIQSNLDEKEKEIEEIKALKNNKEKTYIIFLNI